MWTHFKNWEVIVTFFTQGFSYASFEEMDEKSIQ